MRLIMRRMSMTKWIVKFKLLDGRGWAEQHFKDENHANEFLEWCKRNTELVSNPTNQKKG